VLSHLEQDAWGENAKIWDPKRFDGVKPSPFQFYPFGGGLRRCVGASLAMLEMHYLVEELARQVKIELVSSRTPTLARRGLTLQASCPIWVKLSSRD
jgi:cytochrome P450 family 110